MACCRLADTRHVPSVTGLFMGVFKSTRLCCVLGNSPSISKNLHHSKRLNFNSVRTLISCCFMHSLVERTN
jgi:hypothetical protein